MTEILAQALVAVIAAVGAVYAARASKQAREVNAAVNHRPSGQPSLYELALENRAELAKVAEWQRGYQGGPLDTGAKVIRFVERVEEIGDNVEEIRGRVERIESTHDRLGCLKYAEEKDEPERAEET